MAANGESETVEAVEKTIEILETLRRKNGVRLTELAESTDMSKTTVYRHLQTLNDNGYVVKQGNAYHLSFQFLEFVSAARERETGYSMVEPKVNELAKETKELVQFTIEEHERALFVYREIGEKGIQIAPNLGQPLHLHALAGGKAILAQWSNGEISRFIDRNGLPAHTNNTITDSEAFFDEMQAIRESGYALNDQESTKGLRAVGVPIIKPDGGAIGALTVSAPTNRMQNERFHEEIPNLLKGVTNEIELNFTVI